MGLDRDFAIAFAKSQLGAGGLVPTAGTVFVSVRDSDKPLILDAIRRLSSGSASRSSRPAARSATSPREGVACAKINKVLEGRPHIVDAIKNGEIQLVFNTTEGAHALSDSRSLRRAALLHRVPYYTTVAGSVAASLGIEAYRHGELEVRPLQSYFTGPPDANGGFEAFQTPQRCLKPGRSCRMLKRRRGSRPLPGATGGWQDRAASRPRGSPFSARALKSGPCSTISPRPVPAVL